MLLCFYARGSDDRFYHEVVLMKEDVIDDELNKKGNKSRIRLWIFPFIIIILYPMVLATKPEKATFAVKVSIQILLQIALPLTIAFIMMVMLNLFVNPIQLASLFGKKSGLKGLLISTLAGVFSMGPIYAWYPFLKSLKTKGVPNFHIANFLSSRAVKPFLFPVMIYYFGWAYTVTFNLLIIAGAVIVASVVDVTVKS